jgi:predicted nuclease of restriction endonuclease-like (RecB) superfamily
MNYRSLLKAVAAASTHMVGRAAAVVNQALVLRNWLIGAYLVEYEQGGADRARYGTRLLERLADDLAGRRIKGLDARSLRDCRLLFQVYPQIRGPLDPELRRLGKPVPLALTHTSCTTTEPGELHATKRIRGPVDPELKGAVHAVLPPAPLDGETVLQMSWSKLAQLIRIDDPCKRGFYENECLKGNWSKRQLARQIESLLYERTGLSKNKRATIRRAHRQGPNESMREIIRDPYVLEFLGLEEREEYSESDLEKALLDHLQRFLLELGAGFCFEARQFRITIGRKHERVDLVFYHRRLRCHVLLDLKTRAFQHADAGQMNFYLNWFKANMVAKGDQAPVGIILCSDKDGTEVEFATAGMDNALFVSRYLVALPTSDELRALVEADRARFARQHRIALRKR